MKTHVIARIQPVERFVRPVLGLLVIGAGVLLWTGVHAEDRRERRAPERGMHFDDRFGHNRYYRPRGYFYHGVPHGGYEIHHHGGTYWYHGGQWYRPHGGISIVVAAPLGAYVPVLPPFYSTVWWRGLPYYYADNTYYLWNSGVGKYEVVAAPSELETAAVAPVAEELFIYPKDGQSEQQQERDRYECHRFAVRETGYDPTLPNGGVPATAAANQRSNYLRAQAACLEGRGYTVR